MEVKMFEAEQTNQVTDTFMEGFGESQSFLQAEEGQTGPADAQTQGETQAEDTQVDTTGEMFPRTIKYLGEEKQISYDEAVPLIQKGMNYDRVIDRYKGKLAGIDTDKRVLFVENLAQQAGVDAHTYIAMENNRREYQSLIDEYGARENIPSAIIEKFNKYSQAEMEKSKADYNAAQQKAYLMDKEAEYFEFVENHPEFNGEIPQEVVAIVAQGESLEGAWAIHNLGQVSRQLTQLKKDFEIYKTNMANRNSRLPQGRGTNPQERDDFLTGFMGGF